MRTAFAAVLAASLALSSGCASLISTAMIEPMPYGGTRIDAEGLTSHSRYANPGLKALCALDLAPSFALDTALLPYTAARAALR